MIMKTTIPIALLGRKRLPSSPAKEIGIQMITASNADQKTVLMNMMIGLNAGEKSAD
ncbi:hypothetical protein PJ311_09395 [Bacillus sp. CLL-7-23]|uniref:Uncharacterized protein n=1 Tax=Bacillus changyiensis TaxID=3004103 RepID=A0ABT4X3F8_9BACI|nr:hypothetical protein [Bacillus changyiensis]MDA7026820.1 hypothetical protein [Bacillus changyiensis]